MKVIIAGVAALLLSACQTSGLIDLRCAEAQQTIKQLRETADLYEHDDLVARLQRATRLAEIWCVSDAAAPIPTVPAAPEAPVIDGGSDT